jgi:hypothetical protein
MKYDFREMPSAEIRSLLRQDIDGPNIFATEEIMEAMTVLTKRDPAQMAEINIQKSWQEFLMYYKPDM